jgi:hypothetical protein
MRGANGFFVFLGCGSGCFIPERSNTAQEWEKIYLTHCGGWNSIKKGMAGAVSSSPFL